jgi:hypothetical protein
VLYYLHGANNIFQNGEAEMITANVMQGLGCVELTFDDSIMDGMPTSPQGWNWYEMAKECLGDGDQDTLDIPPDMIRKCLLSTGAYEPEDIEDDDDNVIRFVGLGLANAYDEDQNEVIIECY